MQQQTSGKPSNFILFMVLTFAVVMVHSWIFNKPRGAAPPPEKPGAVAKAEPGKAAEKPAPDKEKEGGKAEKAEKPTKPQPLEEPKEGKEEGPEAEPEEPPAGQGPMPKAIEPQQWFTLGSADPDDPYRMLVTVTDRGAAVARIELNSPRYRTLMDDDGYLAYAGGYLGRVALDDGKHGQGCRVEVVGAGTPAAKAGLKPGDLITKVDDRDVTCAKDLYDAVAKKRPGHPIRLVILRGDKELTLEPKLTRPPMEVIRPEGDDPLSFLMTLSRIDKRRLAEPNVDPDQAKDKRPECVDQELKSLNLRSGTWEVVSHSQEKVEFRSKLGGWGLELVKTYRLEPIPKEKQDDPDYPAYNLLMDVKIRLADGAKKARRVAYQLDGPTGLPIEGWWFANKVGRAWSAGLRDVVVSFNSQTPSMVGCMTIADDKVQQSVWHGGPQESLTYIGVDAQYFSVVLLPKSESGENWFATSQPLRVGPVKDRKIRQVTDVTCRLRSESVELTPDGKPLEHTYTIFAGPKRPAILTPYKLDELVYYGWYDFIARPMVAVLHFFHRIVGNYGLAIVMLTVLVRLLMYPMSRKQALGAQKMAELQPELKRLKEKHKKDLEAFGKAQRALFAKHKYNPLSGCLVMFVQLPIFVGLYNSLRVDVELRGSPLLWAGLRWCSNLSAPDMLVDWHNLLPPYFTKGIGVFVLGPYFNLLPLATVILFQIQQKMFMPPPADEQQAMQQNVMKYMMLFMGLLFFKVASGLCIYIIASSLWSIAERRFLPKVQHAHGGDAGQSNGKKPKPRK
jgi:YidC/Oxa1 family membrane protein insertase